MIIVKIYLKISLELWWAVESVQFQIVPCSSLYFSRSIGPFQCSQCYLQGFNLLQLSLPRWFPLFILASSVCRSLQCLISALIQGGEGGHLFRLICSVVLWVVRNTANKYHRHVWGVLAVSWPHWVCARSRRVCFSSLHCSGFRLLCREQALSCVHFSGLRHSSSGSWVLHKRTDSVGPAFCVLPRSEQLRQPGAWRAHSP